MEQQTIIQIDEGNCPKCEKGYISKREYDEDQYVDYDIPVLDKNGNGMWETHEAIVKNAKGEVQYENGVVKTIKWQEPTMEKIFVIKSTSHVNYDFCSNVMCDWFEKKETITAEYEC